MSDQYHSVDHFSRNQINAHSHICPKAPEFLFDDRSTYFHGVDDEQQRPLSARVPSAGITRQLSNISLNQSVGSVEIFCFWWKEIFLKKISSAENGLLHIRFRPIDLSSLLSTKENKARHYSSSTGSRQTGLCPFSSPNWSLLVLNRLFQFIIGWINSFHIKISSTSILGCYGTNVPSITFINVGQTREKLCHFLDDLLVMIQVYGVAWICLENILKVVIYVMFYYVELSFSKCTKRPFVSSDLLKLKFDLFDP